VPVIVDKFINFVASNGTTAKSLVYVINCCLHHHCDTFYVTNILSSVASSATDLHRF